MHIIRSHKFSLKKRQFSLYVTGSRYTIVGIVTRLRDADRGVAVRFLVVLRNFSVLRSLNIDMEAHAASDQIVPGFFP
jgi:hypothetical protein